MQDERGQAGEGEGGGREAHKGLAAPVAPDAATVTVQVSAPYRARYDAAGRLRPSAASPFEERSAEISQRADEIIQASVQRS